MRGKEGAWFGWGGLVGFTIEGKGGSMGGGNGYYGDGAFCWCTMATYFTDYFVFATMQRYV